MPISLVLEFNPADDLPKEDGLKFAVFKIMQGDKLIGHDWGFANFENGSFEKLVESDLLGTVVKWCELPNTKLLF
jgi:hypothetical protein